MNFGVEFGWKSKENKGRCCPNFRAACFLQVWVDFVINLLKMLGKPISFTYVFNFG